MGNDSRQEKPPADAGTPGMIAMTPNQFQELIATMGAVAQMKGAAPETSSALAAVLQQMGKLTEQFARTNVRENKYYEDVSVFNFDPRCAICKAGGLHPNGDDMPRRAHPKSALLGEVIFCGGPERTEWLTIVETELYNELFRAGKNRECRGGQWTAILDRNGTTPRLHISVPFHGLDSRYDLPSKVAILVEFLHGDAMVNPAEAIALIKGLQDQVKALEARLNSAPATVPAAPAAEPAASAK